MTPEQRFANIEADLSVMASALRGMAEAQQRLTASISQLTETVSLYTDSADRRMTRIEENLDGLIRAITADHSNGKGHKPE